MSTVVLDLREHPGLVVGDSDDDHAGPTEPGSRLRDPRAVPGRERDPAARPGSAPGRLRCADCGTVLAAEDRDFRGEDFGLDEHAPEDPRTFGPPVPVHAVGPDPTTPFAVRLCPRSGRHADPEADAVPLSPQEPPAPPALSLPPGLNWRSRPFSHSEI